MIRNLKGEAVEEMALIKESQAWSRICVLTIDRRFKYLRLTRELKSTVTEAIGARSGSIVVLDVDTGEVLAIG